MVYCHHIIIISPAFCSHFHSVCCPRPSRWGCRSIHPANPTSARKIGRFLLEFCHYWHQYPAKKLVRLMLSAFDCPTDFINIYIQYILYICMIYMFVYCSTCLQSPSSATTPRSDSLEGDRSPSVKKKRQSEFWMVSWRAVQCWTLGWKTSIVLLNSLKEADSLKTAPVNLWTCETNCGCD
jgi:hypothetical protein